MNLHTLLTPHSGEDSQRVTRQVKEAESEAELATQAVTAVRGMMERALSAWGTYNQCLTSLQTWLAQKIPSHAQSPPVGTQVTSRLQLYQRITQRDCFLTP